MNNLFPTSYLHLESSVKQPSAEESTSFTASNEYQNQQVVESKIAISRLSDAELFSTYKPVNQGSIVPVHQLLFC